ncbi:hypothetical protein [Streptomyces scabiei]|uniref:hypothetical protein n=1 Tax=Streptomyces scabiei TaxID=1930 RepID=UPI001C4F7207
MRKGYVGRRPRPGDAPARLVVPAEWGWVCTRAAQEVAAEVVAGWAEPFGGEGDMRVLRDRPAGIAPRGPVRPAW